jgi:hypothetical protein
LKVDAGTVSSKKRRTSFRHIDLQRSAMQVFYCRGMGPRQALTLVRRQELHFSVRLADRIQLPKNPFRRAVRVGGWSQVRYL